MRTHSAFEDQDQHLYKDVWIFLIARQLKTWWADSMLLISIRCKKSPLSQEKYFLFNNHSQFPNARDLKLGNCPIDDRSLRKEDAMQPWRREENYVRVANTIYGDYKFSARATAWCMYSWIPTWKIIKYNFLIKRFFQAPIKYEVISTHRERTISILFKEKRLKRNLQV